LRIKNERDFWSGLVFSVVGIGFAVAATSYSMGPPCGPQEACAASPAARLAQLSAEPGPGYFPLGLGVLLACVGVVILFKSLVLESEGGDPIEAFAWRPLLATVGAIALFGALLQPLGLVVSVVLLAGVASLASPERRWRRTLVVAAALALAAWLVFAFASKPAVPLWPRLFG
jgi:hypothetical protein